MKYIRTKDGRILLGTLNDNDLTGMVLDYQNGEIVKIPIIAQADTIEELCDCYVVWLKNREIPLIERTQKGRRLYPSYFETSECSFDKGYGAIWTDKGLIYVAKMNDKGVLELL